MVFVSECMQMLIDGGSASTVMQTDWCWHK